MDDLQKIAEHKLKSATSGDEITVKSLWENQACVITFFRRFGCGFCRLAAKDFSKIKPLLDEKSVRLIGIGVEELGVEDFIKGKYFDGDLYIDSDKKCYQDMNYKRFGMLNMMTALVSKTSRDATSKVRADNLGYDLKGDKYQVGGTLVVSKGGDKVLLNHKQESLADHVNPAEVLKSLGIEAGVETINKPSDNPVTCDSNTACEVSG